MNNKTHCGDTQREYAGETWQDKKVPKRQSIQDANASNGSSSSTVLYDENWMSTCDILDLERMAEKMAANKVARIYRDFDEAELRNCIPFAGANIEEIRKADALLEQAYDLYFKPGLEAAPRLKQRVEAMIARLESKPHLYCPYEREETIEEHVNRWLDTYTSNPEAELVGFTYRYPYEPKRYIPAVQPRMSTSETNVVLGKRKREMDEDGTVCVIKSSSESTLVFDGGHRIKRARRC